jgi:hypothetical protein
MIAPAKFGFIWLSSIKMWRSYSRFTPSNTKIWLSRFAEGIDEKAKWYQYLVKQVHRLNSKEFNNNGL